MRAWAKSHMCLVGQGRFEYALILSLTTNHQPDACIIGSHSLNLRIQLAYVDFLSVLLPLYDYLGCLSVCLSVLIYVCMYVCVRERESTRIN